MPSRRCAPTAPISKRIKLRQRILVDVSARSDRDHHPRRAGVAAAGAGAGRALRHAAWRRRDSRLPRRAGGRHSVHAVDHVDLLDRRRRRGGRQAVLVPALRHEGPRLHPRADRARAAAAKCSALVLTVDLQVLGQRHRDIKNGMTVPPEIRVRQPGRHRHQAGLGAERVARQAQDLRQHRRPHPRHGKRHSVVEVDGRAIRSDAELEGRRVDQELVARQAHPQGHTRRRGCAHRGQDRRGGDRGVQSRRPPARRRAILDRHAAANRRSARLGTSRSCSTAASARGRT